MFAELFLVFFVLLLSPPSCACKNHFQSVEDISATLRSLENVADFYRRNMDKINLDSIFGLRIAEGIFTKILQKLYQGDSPKSQHFVELQTLLSLVKKTATLALPHIEVYNSEYYHNFKPAVDKPWKSFKDFRKMRLKPEQKYSLDNGNGFPNGKNFSEKVSDKCLTEIIGTASEHKDPCYVSADCLKLMTSNNLQRYGNTHQVLYFLFGIESGCSDVLERELKKSSHSLNKDNRSYVDRFLEEKCVQIFNEFRQLEPNVVSAGETDLFLEQGLVCGILGFEDFLTHKILENILSWQNIEHGCFGTETADQVIFFRNIN